MSPVDRCQNHIFTVRIIRRFVFLTSFASFSLAGTFHSANKDGLSDSQKEARIVADIDPTPYVFTSYRYVLLNSWLYSPVDRTGTSCLIDSCCCTPLSRTCISCMTDTWLHTVSANLYLIEVCLVGLSLNTMYVEVVQVSIVWFTHNSIHL